MSKMSKQWTIICSRDGISHVVGKTEKKTSSVNIYLGLGCHLLVLFT